MEERQEAYRSSSGDGFDVYAVNAALAASIGCDYIPTNSSSTDGNITAPPLLHAQTLPDSHHNAAVASSSAATAATSGSLIANAPVNQYNAPSNFDGYVNFSNYGVTMPSTGTSFCSFALPSNTFAAAGNANSSSLCNTGMMPDLSYNAGTDTSGMNEVTNVSYNDSAYRNVHYGAISHPHRRSAITHRTAAAQLRAHNNNPFQIWAMNQQKAAPDGKVFAYFYGGFLHGDGDGSGEDIHGLPSFELEKQSFRSVLDAFRKKVSWAESNLLVKSVLRETDPCYKEAPNGKTMLLLLSVGESNEFDQRKELVEHVEALEMGEFIVFTLNASDTVQQNEYQGNPVFHLRCGKTMRPSHMFRNLCKGKNYKLEMKWNDDSLFCYEKVERVVVEKKRKADSALDGGGKKRPQPQPKPKPKKNTKLVIDLSDVPEQLPILKSKGRSGASKYQGVTFHNQAKKWQAQIKVEGEKRSLGHYDDEEEAAKDYARAVYKYRGGEAAVERERKKPIDLSDVPAQLPIPSKNKKSKSKFAGVVVVKPTNKTKNKSWKAEIWFDGKRHHIDYYDTEEEAAVDYARAVFKYKKKDV